jgi:hypothetical protein
VGVKQSGAVEGGRAFVERCREGLGDVGSVGDHVKGDVEVAAGRTATPRAVWNRQFLQTLAIW